MLEEPTESLFHQYRGLIGYAASKYAVCSPVLDQQDLFQDGCLMMLEFFRGRADTRDMVVHNTFKKSLFLWMNRMAKRAIEKARPQVEITDIHLDRMLAAADTCVMMKMYVREFMAELRRVLKDTDLEVLDVLVEAARGGDRRADVVRRVQEVSGIYLKTAYKRIAKVRDAARRIWFRAA